MNEELNVKVKFFSEKNGGRTLLPEDLLSIGEYRPHFVAGDPDQKTTNKTPENYLGIAFISQDEPLKEEKEIKATVSKIYPEVDYSTLITGATFTIREGAKIVGNGSVL